MKLLFSEDIDQDIWNWQDAISKGNYGIQWKQFLPSSITIEEIANNLFLRNYLEKEFYMSGMVSDFREWLKDHVVINTIEEDLITLMRRPFLSQKITAYITTFHRAPYDVPGNLFFLIRRTYKREESITTTYHELMHFIFHWHYWDQCKAMGLSDQDIHNFKESITVLLNQILVKRDLPLDKGYPMHEKLRKQWISLYEENSNFPIFLEKALVLYKNQINQ